MVRSWAAPVAMLLLLGVADASAQESVYFRTLAGASPAGNVDGTRSEARFNVPAGIAVDSAGALYVADSQNCSIRKVTAAGVATTFAGAIVGDWPCGNAERSINVAQFQGPGGTAVDTRNNTIRTSAPIPSSLVADFGASWGLWVGRGTTWRQIHYSTAESFVTYREGNHDGLIIDFGPGVGLWGWLTEADGEYWFPISTLSPTAMVLVDFDDDGKQHGGVFDFAGLGLWRYDGDEEEWSQVHPFNASHLAAADLDGDGGQDVIADFPGYGLWVMSGNGTWSQRHPFDVTSMVIADLDGNGRDDLVVNFPGFGVWGYLNGTGWLQIHGFAANRLAAGDLDGNGKSDLVIDFGATYGVSVLSNGTSWAALHPFTTEGITIGDLDGNGRDDVIIDFGGPGIWSHDDIGGWQQLHGFNPKGLAAGRFY